MRVLIALGGNAMTGPDGRARPQDQRAAVTSAMEAVAAVATAGHEVVLTHGNGPQVGNLLVKNEIAASVVPPVPLDWCGAQTQGTIGLLILDALDDALRRLSGTTSAERRSDSGDAVARPVAALVSRTLVAADDPGFGAPSKPIGRYLPEPEARVLIEHGQTWHDRGPRGWRRVVASPEPLACLDAEAAAALLRAGFVVTCSGGGGVPVIREDDGTLRSVEAVVDKDLAAAVLGRQLGADLLVIATDVAAVATGFGTPDAAPLGRTTVAQLRALAAAGEFAAGSMAPKVEAACRFAAGGGRAVITSLQTITEAIAGNAGTEVILG